MKLLCNSLFQMFIILTIFLLSTLIQDKNYDNNNFILKNFYAFPKQVIATQTKFFESKEIKHEVIPVTTIYLDDPDQELGKETVREIGKNGSLEVITTITYYDGQEYERETKENILEKPVDQVIARGTKIVPKTLETEYGGFTYIRKFSDFWATSYDSTCKGCDLTTATGMKQGYGVVAVDPKVIPLGSKLYIPEYGVAIAGDVGGSIKGNRIDLGFDSLNGQWSAKYVDVYLLTN